MGKKIGIAVAAIIIVAAFILVFMRGKKGADEGQMKKTEQTKEMVKSESQQQSLKGLLSANVTKSCTYSDINGTTSSNGTVYVGGGKMRGDFTANVNGKQTGSHMITDGTTSYMWLDDQSVGYKMAFVQPEGSKPSEQGVDANKNYTMSCNNWNVDSSKFTVPTEIKFQDMTEMMKMANPAGTTSKAGTGSSEMMKAACNGLEEPAKTQCLAAVK